MAPGYGTQLNNSGLDWLTLNGKFNEMQDAAGISQNTEDIQKKENISFKFGDATLNKKQFTAVDNFFEQQQKIQEATNPAERKAAVAKLNEMTSGEDGDFLRQTLSDVGMAEFSSNDGKTKHNVDFSQETARPGDEEGNDITTRMTSTNADGTVSQSASHVSRDAKGTFVGDSSTNKTTKNGQDVSSSRYYNGATEGTSSASYDDLTLDENAGGQGREAERYHNADGTYVKTEKTQNGNFKKTTYDKNGEIQNYKESIGENENASGIVEMTEKGKTTTLTIKGADGFSYVKTTEPGKDPVIQKVNNETGEKTELIIGTKKEVKKGTGGANISEDDMKALNKDFKKLDKLAEGVESPQELQNKQKMYQQIEGAGYTRADVANLSADEMKVLCDNYKIDGKKLTPEEMKAKLESGELIAGKAEVDGETKYRLRSKIDEAGEDASKVAAKKEPNKFEKMMEENPMQAMMMMMMMSQMAATNPMMMPMMMKMMGMEDMAGMMGGGSASGGQAYHSRIGGRAWNPQTGFFGNGPEARFAAKRDYYEHKIARAKSKGKSSIKWERKLDVAKTEYSNYQSAKS